MSQTVFDSTAAGARLTQAIEPYAANIEWAGNGLDSYDEMEVVISENHPRFGANRPTLTQMTGIKDNPWRGNGEDAVPITAFYSPRGGDLLARRVTANSLKVWWFGSANEFLPFSVERMTLRVKAPATLSGTLDFTATNTFSEYELTQFLERDALYQFLVRRANTGGPATQPTIPFLGSDILDLTPQPDTTFDPSAEGNIFNLGYGRATLQGAQRLAVGYKTRAANAAVDTLYLASQDTDYDVFSLRRLT